MCRRLCRYGLYASALVVGGLIASDAFPETVNGSGVPATENRPVGPVKEVRLSGVGNLRVVKGAMPSLTITADENLLEYIETDTDDNRLTLRTKSGYRLNTKTPIEYVLTVPHFEKLTVSGAGSARVEKLQGDELEIHVSGAGHAIVQELDCRELKLSLSGAGGMTVAGTAEKVELRISGAGDIDAGALKASSVDVRVSGAGDAKVWATEHLKARVSGAGDIRYHGTPKVEKRTSGAGSVEQVKR